MSAIRFSDDIREEVMAFREYVESHPFALEEIKRMASREIPSVGENPRFVYYIPPGIRCVLSVEEQPAGMFRHLSVSLSAEGLPSPPLVNAIMKEMGFSNILPSGKIVLYLEDNVAVNVMEKIDERT